MKFLILGLLFCWQYAFGQTASLQLSTTKTISLVFPFNVLHVDRGTADVLVQEVHEAKNILLLKAAVVDFAETNLSVVTGDGTVYSFRLTYHEQPAHYVFRFPPLNAVTLADHARAIMDNQPMIAGIRDRKYDMQFSVDGIYIKDDVLFYQLRLHNESAINYTVELLQFAIRDKKKAKRTAIQEQEIKPLLVSGNCKEVKAYSSTVIVVALKKFTIPDGKDFFIRLFEDNGGRHLKLRITNKKLVRGIILPDMR